MLAVRPPLVLDHARPDPRLDWRAAAEEVLGNQSSVTLHLQHIPGLLPLLPKATDHAYWQDYVSPVDRQKPDLVRLFHEMALTIAQFGGFVHFMSDGATSTWKLAGSGVQAVLAVMDRIRKDRLLPGIDIETQVRERMAPFFLGKPFATERVAMLEELSTTQARAAFRSLLAAARGADGRYRFKQEHLLSLAGRFPLSFGADPLFAKKASLLLMTMEIALNRLGFAAEARTIPPADYRIPQILESFGILQVTDDPAGKLEQGHVFRLHDPEVRALRAATVLAVAEIKDALEVATGRPVTMAELDGALYRLSRDKTVMTRPYMKPHMQVATMAF